MRQVKTDLRGKNASDVLTRGRSVLLGMTGNPHFPNPTPSLVAFSAACDALEAANLATVDGGNREAYLKKANRMEEVCIMLKALAAYAGVMAAGDARILIGAGFEYRKPSTRITAMNAPQEVRARTGTLNHTIDVRWKPVHGARMYELYICRGDVRDPDAWELLTLTSNSRYHVTELEALKYYSFRVRALGAHTISPISQQSTALSIGPKAA